MNLNEIRDPALRAQIEREDAKQNPRKRKWPEETFDYETAKTSKPLRQSSKPSLNKTEAEFGVWLRRFVPDDFIVPQGITLRLCNGLRYSPDFVTYNPFTGELCGYEVKGERRKDSRWATEDSRCKIKMAAKVFPFITWTLAWKQNGEWKTQQVKE